MCNNILLFKFLWLQSFIKLTYCCGFKVFLHTQCVPWTLRLRKFNHTLIKMKFIHLSLNENLSRSTMAWTDLISEDFWHYICLFMDCFSFSMQQICMEYVFLESMWYGIRPGSGSENGISTWRTGDINIL
jgi:hypothetical protein